MSKITWVKNNKIYVMIVILVIIIILNMALSYFSRFTQSSLLEGLGKPITKITPTEVTVNLIDKSGPGVEFFPTKKTKDENELTANTSAKLYNIYSEYDTAMTPFKPDVENKVQLMLINDAVITVKPNSEGTAKKNVKFPKSFIFSIVFDKTKPMYYFTNKEKTNMYNKQHELDLYTNSSGITNANYKNIGNIIKEPNAPFMYKIIISDSEDLEAINLHLTTTNPSVQQTPA